MKASFLSGSLDQRVHEHIRNCESCMQVWSALNIVDQASVLRKDPPEDLSDRVITSIFSSLENGKDASGHGRVKRITEFWNATVQQTVKIAAAAVLLVALTVTITLSVARPSNEQQTILVHLVLDAPQAQSVSVVGDWNGWQPDVHQMANTQNGIWEIRIEMKPDGEYRYQFLVDEKDWIPDPDAPLQVADGFGGINSVMNL
ncbi:hypothetical protein JCM12856_21210 [Spirochaeta dissipatitropha]